MKNHSFCAPTPPSGLCLECERERLTEELKQAQFQKQGFHKLASVLIQYVHDLKHHQRSIQFCQDEPCPATLEFLNETRGPCRDDQHRGTECRCCHMIAHCCSHHCCCFYRCKCRHDSDRHQRKGKCEFPGCNCEKYMGE